MKNNHSNALLVIAACSGTGKTTVCQELLENCPNLRLSISFTTRSPRGKEINGIDYHFTNPEQFQSMIQEQKLLEWAEVHGNFYGTGKGLTTQYIQQGFDLLFDIDVQGAYAIQNYFPHNTILIFLLPPSWEELKKRLMGRGTEDEEKVKRRLLTAQKELLEARNFQYILVNQDVSKTAQEIENIRKSHSFKQVFHTSFLDQLIADARLDPFLTSGK